MLQGEHPRLDRMSAPHSSDKAAEGFHGHPDNQSAESPEKQSRFAGFEKLDGQRRTTYARRDCLFGSCPIVAWQCRPADEAALFYPNRWGRRRPCASRRPALILGCLVGTPHRHSQTPPLVMWRPSTVIKHPQACFKSHPLFICDFKL